MQEQGMLFVFEGPDGAGKSTLARLFTEYLNDSAHKPTELHAFPGNKEGSLGHLVYDVHHNMQKFDIQGVEPASLQLLHIAAHIDAITRLFVPTLQKGINIVLDRYWWSTWVYGINSGVDKNSLQLMIDLELNCWNKYLPTLAFLMDRKTSLRPDLIDDQWNRLRVTYYDLLSNERSKYKVLVVNNDSAPETALEKIIEAYTGLFHKSQQGLPDKEGKRVRKRDSQSQELVLTPQLTLDLADEAQIELSIAQKHIYTYTTLEPAKPSEVYDNYWQFAAERQRIFFRKLRGDTYPWTTDEILSKHKFTNAYRASDRVSQYLIKNVIYRGEQLPQELFFRIILFKVFNRISTWQLLEQTFGEVSYGNYEFEKYDAVLSKALATGERIFSAAYIMPSGNKSYGYTKKHRNFLKVIEKMIEDSIPEKLAEARSMKRAFELLRSYPMMGDFLAYQYVIDLNYSTLTNFSESEFVVAGPGALSGIKKCFVNSGGLNEIDLIQLMTERQAEEFARLEIDFPSLWGRPLQLIDCQNLFCEVDKYTRVSHPHIVGQTNRKRIKQIYKPSSIPIDYWFPPKWKLNHLIGKENPHVSFI